MKKLILLLLVIVLVTGCAEQLTQEGTVKEPTVPSPDYSMLQDEYSGEQQSIQNSFREGPTDGKVAVIRIEGILDSEDVMPLAAKLREVEQDTSIKGVILWVDSPGGSVAAVTQITYEIERLNYKKPVVAYTGGVAASGGFYIMSVCDRIVVRPDAEVGSIGVIYVHIDASGYYSQFGFDIEVFKTGEHKDAGADWRDLDEDERQYITDSVYDAFYRFVFTVARGRNLTTGQVEQHADGLTWTGEQAVQWGFADLIGNLDEAIAEIERLTGLRRAELLFIEIEDSGDYREYTWESAMYLYMQQTA
ncbi:MAG: signal peptide peptidase SppA [Theionarchaea archaeon]|nr:signal peptide peptidase SppA [Theionarchaea archaeon]MBU6999818.1 signal peptide peptidase SppA [Theionarchaea archaeon]MBU7020238.1 signal peptide peptidase SppA [Theionarchaea archaeon]MBU7033643.1 signal peptide peptidase SppA [Theionarchaea archaeon]MBU7040082.1 signal peptide peptidase SppA [Theionarchaea archaeon]